MMSSTLDRGWAWVVMFATFGCMLATSVAYCLGVYVAELIIEQDLSRPRVALFGSLQMACLYSAGPTSYLSERTSHRFVIFVFSAIATVSTLASIHIKSMAVLYVTFGVIPGFCVGALSTQSLIIMNRYFQRHANLANCIALAGCSFGTLIFPSIFRHNIAMYGWRGSLYIVAAIFLNGCVLAMCMRPVDIEITPPTETHVKPANTSVNSVYRKPSFYLFLVNNFFWCFAWPIVFVFAPTLFYENGMEGWQIDILLSIIGFSNTIIRVIAAFVLNITTWDISVVHMVPIYGLGVSLLMFVVHPGMPMFTIASLLFGATYGMTNCTQSLMARHIGGDYFNIVYSWAYAACTFGTVFGPFLSGFIYNATHSFTSSFLVFASIAFLSATTTAVSLYVDRRTGNIPVVHDVDGQQEFEVTTKTPTSDKPVSLLEAISESVISETSSCDICLDRHGQHGQHKHCDILVSMAVFDEVNVPLAEQEVFVGTSSDDSPLSDTSICETVDESDVLLNSVNQI